LQPDRRLPDLALQLGLGGQGGDRVDGDEVEAVTEKGREKRRAAGGE
jgi:hypothetical protein